MKGIAESNELQSALNFNVVKQCSYSVNVLSSRHIVLKVFTPVIVFDLDIYDIRCEIIIPRENEGI